MILRHALNASESATARIEHVGHITTVQRKEDGLFTIIQTVDDMELYYEQASSIQEIREQFLDGLIDDENWYALTEEETAIMMATARARLTDDDDEEEE